MYLANPKTDKIIHQILPNKEKVSFKTGNMVIYLAIHKFKNLKSETVFYPLSPSFDFPLWLDHSKLKNLPLQYLSFVTILFHYQEYAFLLLRNMA